MTDTKWAAVPNAYRWPNLTRDLDYRTLTRTEVIELDRLCVSEGILPVLPPVERLTGVALEADEAVRGALDAIESEVLLTRWRIGEGEVGLLKRMRLLSHAWHRLRERIVCLDGQTWLDFDYWRDELAGEGAGSCVYNQFVSAYELENYILSWLSRGLAWSGRLASRAALGEAPLRAGSVESVGLLEKKFQEIGWLWKDVDLDLSGLSGLPGGGWDFGAREAVMHTIEVQMMGVWSRAFVFATRKDLVAAADVYGARGSRERVVGSMAMREENKLGKKLAYRCSHTLLRGLAHMHATLLAEAHAESEESERE